MSYKRGSLFHLPPPVALRDEKRAGENEKRKNKNEKQERARQRPRHRERERKKKEPYQG